jgi:nucleotide-binding universal stress UspA family protein
MTMAAMDWKKICCPVDFSEPTQTALRVAVDLCRRLGSELVFLHVDAAVKLAEELPHGSVEAQLTALKDDAQRRGAQRVALARAPGEPVLAIVEFAKKNAIELIVMGTHGRVDRELTLTGSVAEAVVRKAECPVLTVHPGWKA